MGEDEEAQADDEEEDGILLGFELLFVSLLSIFKRVDGCLGVFLTAAVAAAVVPVAPP